MPVLVVSRAPSIDQKKNNTFTAHLDYLNLVAPLTHQCNGSQVSDEENEQHQPAGGGVEKETIERPAGSKNAFLTTVVFVNRIRPKGRSLPSLSLSLFLLLLLLLLLLLFLCVLYGEFN